MFSKILNWKFWHRKLQFLMVVIIEILSIINLKSLFCYYIISFADLCCESSLCLLNKLSYSLASFIIKQYKLICCGAPLFLNILFCKVKRLWSDGQEQYVQCVSTTILKLSKYILIVLKVVEKRMFVPLPSLSSPDSLHKLTWVRKMNLIGCYRAGEFDWILFGLGPDIIQLLNHVPCDACAHFCMTLSTVLVQMNSVVLNDTIWGGDDVLFKGTVQDPVWCCSVALLGRERARSLTWS